MYGKRKGEKEEEHSMITYICGSDIKYSEFPKVFWEDLENCMERGDEILLGDSDFAHRVYGRCKNKRLLRLLSRSRRQGTGRSLA